MKVEKKLQELVETFSILIPVSFGLSTFYSQASLLFWKSCLIFALLFIVYVAVSSLLRIFGTRIKDLELASLISFAVLFTRKRFATLEELERWLLLVALSFFSMAFSFYFVKETSKSLKKLERRLPKPVWYLVLALFFVIVWNLLLFLVTSSRLLL